MKVSAPAKINLSLRVLGCRPDGYHALRTLMCPLTLADSLEVEAGEGEGIHLLCDDPSLPVDASNLAVKAAAAFLEVFRLNRKISIRLDKNIPHGAGLAGGSSDAAAVLLALAQLEGVASEDARLHSAAAGIGSDVAFFLGREIAWCEGRGEIVRSAGLSLTMPVLLAKPPFGVSTSWAYSRWQEVRELSGLDYAPQSMPWGEMVNDLERPVFEKYPLLGIMKRWLRGQTGVRGALLSGSGSTVFALLEADADAGILSKGLREQFGESLWIWSGSTGRP